MNRRICTTDRDELRRWIPDGYSPVRHLVGMYTLGLTAMAGLLWRSLTGAPDPHLLLVPGIFLVATFLEYAAHRWLMHVSRAWLPQAWQAHMGRHHHYYRADAATWDSPRDIWLILFSPFDVLLLCAILAGPFALLRRALPPGDWALTLATCIAYFLLYEACHLSFHLPPSHWLFRLPPLARLRARHLRHHLLTDTHANYGVVLPLWDHVFGTSRS